MKARLIFASAFIRMIGVALPGLLYAQADEPPFQWGAFQTSGAATVGYRFDEVRGRKETFQQLFDLQSGFRVFDFNLTGKAKGWRQSFHGRLPANGQRAWRPVSWRSIDRQ